MDIKQFLIDEYKPYKEIKALNQFLDTLAKFNLLEYVYTDYDDDDITEPGCRCGCCKISSVSWKVQIGGCNPKWDYEIEYNSNEIV